jgi:hypothetical protein
MNTTDQCVTGWDVHGHAILTGRPADRWLASGQLQDAENCGYDPSATLADMGVDETRHPAGWQYLHGRIRLQSGEVLVRGGTLGCVWAHAHPLAILNTSIVTQDGTYTLRTIDLPGARDLVADAPGIDSAVGHDATAAVLTELLGVEVPVNRQQFAQQPGQIALVLKMDGRPPEGVVLDRAGMEQIGYTLRLLTRTA